MKIFKIIFISVFVLSIFFPIKLLAADGAAKITIGSHRIQLSDTTEEGKKAKKSQSKIVTLMNLLKEVGSQPVELYKPQHPGNTVGVDFKIPGTDLSGTTFYTRKANNKNEAWHIAFTLNSAQVNNIQPLTKAYTQLSDVFGTVKFKDMVLIISEADVELGLSTFNKASDIYKVLKPYERKASASGGKTAATKPTVGLKKGINIFTNVEMPSSGPLKAWQHIVMAGGTVKAGSAISVNAQLGYDVLDKIFEAKKVKTDEAEEKKDKAAEKKEPLPFAVSLTFPKSIPLPFNLMDAAGKANAKNAFYAEIDKTTFSIAINKASGKISLSAGQKNRVWIANNNFVFDSKLAITQEKSGNKKKVTVEGKGAVDIDKNKLQLGLPDFYLVGLNAKVKAMYHVSAKGDVEKQEESTPADDTKKDADRAVGLGFGVTLQYGRPATKVDAKITANIEKSNNKTILKDVSVGLAGNINFAAMNGFKDIPIVQKGKLSNLNFGIAPARKNSTTGKRNPANFYITGGLSIDKVGGRVAFITRNKQLFLIAMANQFSVADIVDTFGGQQAKANLKGNDRVVMSSITMPQVIFAVGASTSKKAATDPLEISTLPVPVKEIVDDVVSASNKTIPITTNGISVVGKIDYKKLDKSAKDAMKNIGVDVTGDLLAAISAEGLNNGKLKLKAVIFLPRFAFPKNELGKVVSMDNTKASFFIALDQPANAFQAGISGDMTLNLPRSGSSQPDKLKIVGDAYVNLQATGTGVRISGYTKGDWNAPMGFEGMTFKNGAILVGVDSEGAVEFGTGMRVVFDVPNAGRNLKSVKNLTPKQSQNFMANQLQNLQSYKSSKTGSVPNDIEAGFVVNMLVSTGIPAPKKLGFVYKASSVSIGDMVAINNTLVRGVVTGDMGNTVVNLFKDGDPVKAILKDVQRGAKINASNGFIANGSAPSIPLDVIKFKNVEIFFATPGAVLPGFPSLNGNMGLALAADVYVKNENNGQWKMVRVPNTTKKFEIRLTTEGISFGGLEELIENTYHDINSGTIAALAAEMNCPKGAFFDVGYSSCWSCPPGYERSVTAVTSSDACVKRTLLKSRATFLQNANLPWNCPTGSFYDPHNEGECWSCPSGFARNANPVTHAKACTQISLASTKPASNHGRAYGWFKTDCAAGQFWDPNGNCYSCPKGYVRGVTPVTAKEACFRLDVKLKETKATLVKAGKPNVKGAFFDVGLGQFWKCPEKTPHRTIFSVKSDHACEFMKVETATGKSVARSYLKIGAGATQRCLGFDFTVNPTTKRIRIVEGARVHLDGKCSQANNRSQSWFVDSAKRIRPLQLMSFNKGEDMMLCLESNGTGANTKMKLARCTHEQNQKWFITNTSKVQNIAEGKCLNLSAQLVDCNAKGSKDQHWTWGPTLVPKSQAPKVAKIGPTTIQSDLNGFCLTGGKAPKYIVDMQRCKALKTQVWTLTPKGELKTAANNCLAIAAGNTEAGKKAGAAVKTYKCIPNKQDGSIPQGWEHFRWYIDDQRRIRSAVNNLCLDVINANKKEGARLGMWNCTGTAQAANAAQAWQVLTAPAQPKPIKPMKRPQPYYLKAARYKKGTGLLGTDCPKGQFWDIIDSHCYSCPIGTNRYVPEKVNSPKACVGYGKKPGKITYAGGVPPKPSPVIRHNWKQVAGSATQVAISSTGVVWHLGNGGIYFYDNGTKKWQEVIQPNNRREAISIAAGKADSIYMVSKAGAMYKGNHRGQWKKLPGVAGYIAAGPDGHVWHLSKAKVGPGGHAIYRLNRNGSGWDKIPGEATKLTAGPNGIAYKVNTLGKMYVMEKGQKQWTAIAGLASDISVGGNNHGTVWHLSKAEVGRGGHAVYRSEDKGNTWKQVSGELKNISAAPNGEAWGVNKPGYIYNGNTKTKKLPRVSYACPTGFNKNLTKKWAAVDACEREIFKKATKHKKLDASCPAGQQKQLVGKYAGYCISCPAGYNRDIAVIDPKNNKACFKTSNRRSKATYKRKGYGLFGTDCNKGEFLWIPTGNCFTCPTGTISDPTISPDDANHCKGASTARRAATLHSKPATSCPANQFQHLNPFPSGWFGHCVSCPKGYNRNANPVNAGNACHALERVKAVTMFK